MAVKSLTVENVRKSGRKLYVRWNDKSESEFSSVEDAQQFVDSALDLDVLKALAVSRYLFIDPTASNPGVIEGKSITFSNEQNAMVQVSNG